MNHRPQNAPFLEMALKISGRYVWVAGFQWFSAQISTISLCSKHFSESLESLRLAMSTTRSSGLTLSLVYSLSGRPLFSCSFFFSPGPLVFWFVFSLSIPLIAFQMANHALSVPFHSFEMPWCYKHLNPHSSVTKLATPTWLSPIRRVRLCASERHHKAPFPGLCDIPTTSPLLRLSSRMPKSHSWCFARLLWP